MNDLIQKLQEVVDKKADNQDIKKELGSLLKMLKTGFDKKTTGMEKVPKLFASNDTKKIIKFYDQFANTVNGLKVSGNFDQFAQYLEVTYGIKVVLPDNAPNNKYVSSKKKLEKFKDLFTGYFIEDMPKNANEAIKKILKSIDALTKEINKENDSVKETIKEIIEKENEHSPATVKTIEKIMTSSRLKSIDIKDVTNELEQNLQLQLEGIYVLNGDSTDENY